VTANRRFAQAAAEQAAPGATVWVHDYQLQLVPRMLRVHGCAAGSFNAGLIAPVSTNRTKP
jgi:trehalose-6-phosphate synthase